MSKADDIFRDELDPEDLSQQTRGGQRGRITPTPAGGAGCPGAAAGAGRLRWCGRGDAGGRAGGAVPPMSTAADMAAKMAAIGPELAKLDHLPEPQFVIINALGDVSVHPKTNYSPWDGARKVLAWAEHFDARVDLQLSHSASGKVAAELTLGGIGVEVLGNVGTSQAYELGRVLGTPLSYNGLTITAARLREALDEIAPAATS